MLQYWYPYVDPYAKQIKANLTLQHVPHATKQENWHKKLVNCCDSPNLPKFFPLQSFFTVWYCTTEGTVCQLIICSLIKTDWYLWPGLEKSTMYVQELKSILLTNLVASLMHYQDTMIE